MTRKTWEFCQYVSFNNFGSMGPENDSHHFFDPRKNGCRVDAFTPIYWCSSLSEVYFALRDNYRGRIKSWDRIINQLVRSHVSHAQLCASAECWLFTGVTWIVAFIIDLSMKQDKLHLQSRLLPQGRQFSSKPVNLSHEKSRVNLSVSIESDYEAIQWFW